MPACCSLEVLLSEYCSLAFTGQVRAQRNLRTTPSVHNRVPFAPPCAVPHLNTIEQFPLTMQTEGVRGVPCGSSSGVEMSFKRVEVVWKVSSALRPGSRAPRRQRRPHGHSLLPSAAQTCKGCWSW